jgi:hypothetical protein
LDAKHAMNYVIRGYIQLSKENFSVALIAFVQANTISADLWSFRGESIYLVLIAGDMLHLMNLTRDIRSQFGDG